MSKKHPLSVSHITSLGRDTQTLALEYGPHHRRIHGTGAAQNPHRTRLDSADRILEAADTAKLGGKSPNPSIKESSGKSLTVCESVRVVHVMNNKWVLHPTHLPESLALL